MRMNRIPAVVRPCVLLIVAATFAKAQEPAPQAAAPNEFGALKQAVEQQTKQMEALTQQITELNRRMAAQQPSAAAPVPATPPSGAAPAHVEPPAPAASTPTAALPAPEAKPQPAAAAPTEGVKHTVAKGETLTSIAKHYNIPLSELEKANKITDDRKLQIGHVLNIPSPANKTPEPPTDKKENP